MTRSSLTAGVHTIAEILSEPQIWTQCLAQLQESGELVSLNQNLNKDRGIWNIPGMPYL